LKLDATIRLPWTRRQSTLVLDDEAGTT